MFQVLQNCISARNKSIIIKIDISKYKSHRINKRKDKLDHTQLVYFFFSLYCILFFFFLILCLYNVVICIFMDLYFIRMDTDVTYIV